MGGDERRTAAGARPRRGARPAALTALWAGILALTCALAACSGDGTPATTPSSAPTTSATTTGPVDLTFGVYGNAVEQRAYRQVVATWNQAHPDVQVTLTEVPQDTAGLARMAASGSTPDLFMVNRLDLGQVLQDQLTQPVGDLLDQPGRDVDFGDGYVIDAVRAFAGDNNLQCMPYGYSPMVIYRNTRLVSFRQMERAGYEVPTRGGRWTFEQFADAARWAVRPGSGAAAGVYVSPTLRGLAPFIYSGGGQIFDDPGDPTSLAFSDGGTQSALQTTLGLLRDPLVDLSAVEQAQRTPEEWFARGRLGLIAGFRSLTPELRAAKGLRWDVMPMPSLGDNRTVGDATGLCLARDTAHVEQAADFLYYVSSADAVSVVARTGYLDPANIAVAASDAFTQVGQRPRSSNVFAYAVRDIVLPPVLDTYDQLDAAVGADLRALVEGTTPELDLVSLGAAIDQASQAVLNPPTASASSVPSSGSSSGPGSASPGTTVSPSPSG